MFMGFTRESWKMKRSRHAIATTPSAISIRKKRRFISKKLGLSCYLPVVFNKRTCACIGYERPRYGALYGEFKTKRHIGCGYEASSWARW